MGPGIKRFNPEFRIKCNCRYKINRNVNYEYLNYKYLKKSARKKNNKLFGFLYYETGKKAGYMREIFLNSKYALFECNFFYNCRNNCRGRVT